MSFNRAAVGLGGMECNSNREVYEKAGMKEQDLGVNSRVPEWIRNTKCFGVKFKVQMGDGDLFQCGKIIPHDEVEGPWVALTKRSNVYMPV